MIKLTDHLAESYPQMTVQEPSEIIFTCQATGRHCIAILGEICPIVTGTTEGGINNWI